MLNPSEVFHFCLFEEIPGIQSLVVKNPPEGIMPFPYLKPLFQYLF